ncbi:AAA family ATPase [Pseudomonas nicosulfuronedens]|uniref:AAA family ATPase n=1 Tax=Pseudomonas nicosulfuronedens TaxID=2571105 RepID=A0A5R9R7M9_9PSED|nr:MULTISPECIES: AAA family ATPase [Pseudomonas]TLX69671.1 AAA family ATPase [Pseudomonas nicosulfuronedens]
MQFKAQVPVSAFGFVSDKTAPAFSSGHEWQMYVPPEKKYFFREMLLKPFMNWLYAPFGDSALLVGPTGSGKSSIVEQLAARLNWPCITVSAHSRMEMPELVGYNLPVTDQLTGDLNTKFVDGPLTKAMRNGFLFVLDEWDTLDPAVTVGLHAVLEGRPLVIAENNGEVVKAHPNFRFVGCGNTKGQGDGNGLHAGTMMQNLASLDRFRVFDCPYLSEKEELKALLDALPEVDASIAQRMVRIANSIRDQHQGKNGQYLSVTMSTRTVLRWARIATGYASQGVSEPAKTALFESLLNRCDQVQQIAINQIAKSVFGNDWK